MKISAQEGYGLRILLSIARYGVEQGLTINQISEKEELSAHNVAKILRELRIGGFVNSSRGQSGGYTLTAPANQIMVKDVLEVLGGKLFGDDLPLEQESSINKLCTDSNDCSLRSLWKVLQFALDRVLEDISLQDLIGTGEDLRSQVLLKLNQEIAV